MFPSFIGILDIQSWWEVPSIAYFCSLFRTAFNLLDFDIEELEEALLTDGTEETGSSLLTELIVRLLTGCLGNNDVSAFNYQMFLRRLFRRKCQETGRYNPFNTDIDFQFLPLRTKVEILYGLCEFRLDADDVFELFKNLEAESLRVEPLGWDANDSAYWYFYGTRLYREDVIKKPKGKNKKKKGKEGKKRGWFYGDDWLDDEDTERVWQVVCFTQEDWGHLTEKFSRATSKVEKELYRSLSQNFLPEIPRLFQEKERLQRKRLLELAPRRTSSRVLRKIKQKEEENKPSESDTKSLDEEKKDSGDSRETRAKRRELIRSQSASSVTSDSESSDTEMPQRMSKRSGPKGQDKRSKNCSGSQKGEPPPTPPPVPVKAGRKTNNSLASATGQIVIPDNDEPVNSTRKKLKTSQIFSQTEEDIQTDMYKVLEQLTAHEDAWPFMDPVEEEYAPNYYAVIRRPMDLRKMEERLDTGYYTDFSVFKADFKLIVNNCRLYNGQDNEYTTMVDNLQGAFDRLTEKYMHRLSSSDEEIAVEYQLPTPSRKHKLKQSESPVNHKRRKRKSHSETGESEPEESSEVSPSKMSKSTTKAVKESNHKSKVKEDVNNKGKDGKLKKKRKGHHRHGKHSKNHKKDAHHKSGHKHGSKKDSKKHGKDGKKSKGKKKRKCKDTAEKNTRARSPSQESLESSFRSRSASPLPSIHTTPTPTPPPTPPPEADSEPEQDFYKDKFDKIKERRRNAQRDNPNWESLFEAKQRTIDKEKQNLHIPEKEKNQKLRETIEKLKAKNEKYKGTSLFNSLFKVGSGTSDKTFDSKSSKDSSTKLDYDNISNEDTSDSRKTRPLTKKNAKKDTATKNESASEALEQAVKDISKWLEEAPKRSNTSSPCESPAPTVSTEEQDSRQDDESSHDKPFSRKDHSRKRPSSRDSKIVKRREIQRTIDRLQPGKSKGNLLNSKNTDKVDEIAPAGPLNKVRESSRSEESSPKLSLGSVLATVEFTLGKDHNFDNDDNALEDKPDVASPKEESSKSDAPDDSPPEDVVEIKKEEIKAPVEPAPPKLSQEKATPNLSAWFKAFGAPKSTPAPAKKKEEDEDKEEKTTLRLAKNSPVEEGEQVPEGGDSPAQATPRQRRTSTGSSVSERSSFSQDLDSPRHPLSHNSPLLRSPASPRDDFQKITYPIINGTVRAGFYQDTTSKSSPEKSCSPREGPQSPYSPYSPHVYANNALGPGTPNYFGDHNKSPLPTYGLNQPPPYYDSTKIASAPKPRVHEDYTALGPDSFQHPSYATPCSPVSSPFPPPAYSQPLASPQLTTPTPAVVPTPETKGSLFPVKKRTYTETESSTPKLIEAVEKIDYTKPITPSVDNIASALAEKSELAKINREKAEFSSEIPLTNPSFADDKAMNTTAENVDMINMGYMNPEERRPSNDIELEYARAEAHKHLNQHSHPKGYEIDTIALNLGMSNQHLQKKLGNIPPAHSQAHSQTHPQGHPQEVSQHLHHANYEAMVSSSINSFSLNDIELANKKLYSCSAPSTAIDYGNWKLNPNLSRKQEAADYSGFTDKLKQTPASYSKSVSQYQHYNPPGELRIPNPRGHLKPDAAMTEAHAPEKTEAKQKEKITTSHPLVGSLQYKPPYSHALTLPNIPQVLERYGADERYLSGFSYDKFQMAQMSQMFNKSVAETSTAYSQSKDSYPDKKKRKRETKAAPTAAAPAVPGSAFNYGAGGMGLYDNGGFMDTANQLMAANYMAAVAQQRSDKSNKGFAPRYYEGSAVYQQYLQHQQLLRQSGVMGLYPPAPPYPLPARQPYDALTRPSWL